MRQNTYVVSIFCFLFFWLSYVCFLHWCIFCFSLCRYAAKTSENLKIIQSKFNYISCEFDCLYSIRKRLKCNFRILFVCFDGFPHLFFSFVVVTAAAVVFATFLFASFVLLCDGCNFFVFIRCCCVVHIYRYIEKVIFYFVNFRPFVLVWLHRTMLGLVRILSSRPNYSGQTNWLINTLKTKSHIGSVDAHAQPFGEIYSSKRHTSHCINFLVDDFFGNFLTHAFYLVCLFVAYFYFFLLFLCQNIT